MHHTRRTRAPLFEGLHDFTEELGATLRGEVQGTGSVNKRNVVNPTTLPKKHFIRDIVKDLVTQAPGHLTADLELLASWIEQEVEGGVIDDRKYQASSPFMRRDRFRSQG